MSMKETLNIFIADDMKHERIIIEAQLKDKLSEFCSLVFHHVQTAEKLIKDVKFIDCDVAIIDIDFSASGNSRGMTGLEACLAISNNYDTIHKVILSSQEDYQVMIDAVYKYKADYYLRRSNISYDELKRECLVALLSKLHRKNKLLEEEHFFYSTSEKVQALLKKVDRISENQNVMIYGETGTGKELIAHRINSNSKVYSSKSERPLVILDCASKAENLIESALFGHVKGAYSDASEDKVGAIELADGGDLFIDEFQNVSLNIQKKLLRVLNSGEFHRVGEEKRLRKSKFRVITALNIPIEEAVEKGLVREDIEGRLKNTYIRLLPLRERKEDIPFLTKHFQSKVCSNLENPVDKEFSTEAIKTLLEQNWPRNIRGLKNTIELVLLNSLVPIISKDDILVAVIQEKSTRQNQKNDFQDSDANHERDFQILVDNCINKGQSYSDVLSSIEKSYIISLLKKHKELSNAGISKSKPLNVSSLAESLGISRRKLVSRLEQYQINLM